jgi:VIT1/CCC1 family predicted Fe2+/Mn2+ transporter
MDDKLFEILKGEREISDRSYAIKIVERIVFGLIALVCVGVVTALLKLILLP